jgi:hypothetical protein
MTKRMNKNTKPVLITARVEANTGDVAFCCATNDQVFMIRRGHDCGVLDMFPDEFKSVLSIGRRLKIWTDDKHYMYDVNENNSPASA